MDSPGSEAECAHIAQSCEVWSLARLVVADPRLGRYDAVARGLFTVAMVRALQHGATPLLIAFAVVELGFAVAQAVPVRAEVVA